MRIYLLPFVLILIYSSAGAQTVTFDDGTTVEVNHLSFDYNDIRRASLGFVFTTDGYAGVKYATASFLQPEKFHIAANLGLTSISLESTIFFSGKIKQKEKSFAVKYSSPTYHHIDSYYLSTEIEKRRDIGVYVAVNDYGNLLKVDDETDAFGLPFLKQTRIYGGIAFVNYWHTHINVDKNSTRRGQFTGRLVAAPFFTLGTEVDSLSSIEGTPKYGARLMYELSNSFGILGGSMKGRTNFVLRAGVDAAFAEDQGLGPRVFLGLGLVYNFAKGGEY